MTKQEKITPGQNRARWVNLYRPGSEYVSGFAFMTETFYNEPIMRFLTDRLQNIGGPILDVGADVYSPLYMPTGKRYIPVNYIGIGLPLPTQHNWPRVEGDAQSLPFPPDYFPAVVCKQAYSYLSNPDRALRHMIRVLQPGGRLFLLDFDGSFSPPRRRRVQGSGDFVPEQIKQQFLDLDLTEVQIQPLIRTKEKSDLFGEEIDLTLVCVSGRKKSNSIA